MKSATVLSRLLLAGTLWAAPLQSRPARSAPKTPAVSACEQEWQAMAQLHRDQAAAIMKDISGLRSLLTMLRNDAGIARDSSVRDGLQVSADMWQLLLDNLQRQAAALQSLAGQEQSKGQVLCRSR